MKEQLYTIPLMDAYRADEECPFCFIERNLEQHAIDFTLGSQASYMEDDIRAQTDEMGFCREHYRQMFVYGNKLGSALILETHMKKLAQSLKKEMGSFSGEGKRGMFARLRKASEPAGGDNVSGFIRSKTGTCYICEQMKNNYDRYIATFFELYRRNDPDFRKLLTDAKGYCLPHFADILEAAPGCLNDKEFASLREILFPQMEKSMDRILEDVDWFQKKFDYRFKDEDWKNSRDAVQRAMQKVGSGYPADPPYVQK